MATDDAVRDGIIKRSRDVLKNAKVAIYCLHRAEDDKAEGLLREAVKIANEELLPVTERLPHLRQGSLAAALEEYAEARVFQAWLRTDRIPNMDELAPCNRDEYLGGVLDFAGEVVRWAIRLAARRDAGAVERALEAVE